MHESKVKRNIRPRQPIFMDRMDESVVEKAKRHPEGISPADMMREYPDEFGDTPRSTLYYRVNSLSKDGYLRVERQRGTLLIFPTGD